GEQRTVTVQLNGLAQSFPAGHRLRVSVSTSYWPLVWPSPEPVQLTIDPNASALLLPVRPASVDDDAAMTPRVGDPAGAPPLETPQIQPSEHNWAIKRNLVDRS